MSRELDRYTQLSEFAFSWVQQYQNDIRAELESFRLERCNQQPFVQSRLDPERRMLSEMPICEALGHLRPPPDFNLCRGSVQTTEMRGARLVSETYGHIFWLSKDRTVLCLTVGQFVSPRDSQVAKGGRIAILKRMGPSLIRVIPNELAVLCGPAETIKRDLKLVYSSFG